VPRAPMQLKMRLIIGTFGIFRCISRGFRGIVLQPVVAKL